MSDPLRSKLIRLAHANPSLRGDILPLLQKKAGGIPKFTEEQKKLALEAINTLLKKIGAPVKWTNINENAVNVAVPKGLSSIFSSLSIRIDWYEDAEGGISGSLGWSYDHPTGGSNGLRIGRVGFDPVKGKWGWRNDGKREFGFID